MPFDPKIIGAGDADFDATAELKLPPDLALMGEQLQDDASRLAACYPPPMPGVLLGPEQCSVLRKSSRPVSTWLVRSLAGTALAAGLVTISLVASNAYRAPLENTPAPAAVLEAPSLTDNARVPVTSASWLGDTSAPELEALMDLLEQDKPAVRSLSF